MLDCLDPCSMSFCSRGINYSFLPWKKHALVILSCLVGKAVTSLLWGGQETQRAWEGTNGKATTATQWKLSSTSTLGKSICTQQAHCKVPDTRKDVSGRHCSSLKLFHVLPPTLGSVSASPGSVQGWQGTAGFLWS